MGKDKIISLLGEIVEALSLCISGNAFDAWQSNLHPRDEDGKFAEKGTGTTGTSSSAQQTQQKWEEWLRQRHTIERMKNLGWTFVAQRESGLYEFSSKDSSAGKAFADTNGNCWYSDNEEECLANSKTLVNCYDCQNCANCEECEDCIDCNGCAKCTECERCNGCENCTECERCRDCQKCTGCKRSSGCEYCESCENCSQCDTCSESAFCDGCYNCHYSYELYDCKYLQYQERKVDVNRNEPNR